METVDQSNLIIEEEKGYATNIMATMEQPLDTVQEDEETIIVNTPSEVGDII
jgi:hypothetical protein